MSAPDYEADRPTQYWVIAILTEYVTWPCDLEVMSRDATWVVNACANLYMYMTYRSSAMTITIFHWPPA